MKEILSIQDFSKLTGIGVPLLRYYDTIDLLKPVYRGDNNYRYYHIDQVEQAYLIVTLRQVGISLNDIKQCLGNQHLEKTRLCLNHALTERNAELEQLKNQIRILEKTIADINSVSMIMPFYQDDGSFVIEHREEVHYYVSQPYFDLEHRFQALVDFFQTSKKQNILATSANIGHIFDGNILQTKVIDSYRIITPSQYGDYVAPEGYYLVCYRNIEKNKSEIDTDFIMKLQSALAANSFTAVGDIIIDSILNVLITDSFFLKYAVRIEKEPDD